VKLAVKVAFKIHAGWSKPTSTTHRERGGKGQERKERERERAKPSHGVKKN